MERIRLVRKTPEIREENMPLSRFPAKRLRRDEASPSSFSRKVMRIPSEREKSLAIRSFRRMIASVNLLSGRSKAEEANRKCLLLSRLIISI